MRDFRRLDSIYVQPSLLDTTTEKSIAGLISMHEIRGIIESHRALNTRERAPARIVARSATGYDIQVQTTLLRLKHQVLTLKLRTTFLSPTTL